MILLEELLPEEIKEMKRKIAPYEDGCFVRSDAPEEIKELEKKLIAWYREQTDGLM